MAKPIISSCHTYIRVGGRVEFSTLWFWHLSDVVDYCCWFFFSRGPFLQHFCGCISEWWPTYYSAPFRAFVFFVFNAVLCCGGSGVYKWSACVWPCQYQNIENDCYLWCIQWFSFLHFFMRTLHNIFSLAALHEEGAFFSPLEFK